MAVNWTPQQKEVIQSRDCNLIVSAAAGSGKTAVLVERIIEMLTRPQDPVDIDRLLVVTFTRAAAAEMRERIGKGIDKKLQTDPGNRQLQHQKLILGAAQISTIHSLCKSLIQENFETLEIDPSFRMGEENELKILKQDVAADMLEGYYASGNQAFRNFVDRYAARRADEGIIDMILSVYEFSRAYPAPDIWLERCADLFSGRDGEETPLQTWLLTAARETVRHAVSLLEEGMQIIHSPGGPLPYEETLSSDLESLRPLLDAESYDSMREGLRAYAPVRLSTKKGKDIDAEKKSMVKALRTQAKETVTDFAKEYLRESSGELSREIDYLRPSIRMLTDLVKDFSERFRLEKADRNMMDFGDLEHETLRLLARFDRDEKGDLTIQRTPAAAKIASFYDAVICDEYQDSNLVQEVILDLLSGREDGRNNRFMVGDVKQSIYRFRQADARIFMNTARLYGQEDGCRRIDLNQNFRSRMHILEGINHIFARLMQEETCGICYDEREALRRDPDTLYPPAEGRRIAGKTDLILIDLDKEKVREENHSREELEAAAIAERILDLTGPEAGIAVYDRDRGEYRHAGFGDVAVLYRGLGTNADMLVRALSARGIPVCAQISKGFFETTEIRTMTALLQIIDNPEQDIPAAAVLRAPFVGLTSEELALLRAGCPDRTLITACRLCGPEKSYYLKLVRFLDQLESFRRAADYMEMDAFIRYLYEETGYYALAAAMPAGRRRQANLDLLLENAVSFAKGSMSGLFRFVRYLEQIKKNAYDAGEASPDAADGSVQIMTIHKSKGLEFPIVILGDLGKRFNWQDLQGTVLLHREYGIGLDVINLETRRKLRSAGKRYLALHLKRETLEEEMRILYVAMTRAREKLLMVGSVENLDKKREKWDLARRSGPDAGAILSASCYLDWIMPCVMAEGGEEYFTLEMEDTASLLGRLLVRTAVSRQNMEEAGTEQRKLSPASLQLQKELSEDAAWSYPWARYAGIKGKYSVSELKAQHRTQEEEMIYAPAAGREKELPSFMREEETAKDKLPYLTGAGRGTAFHRVMELLDFAAVPEEEKRQDWLKSQIDAMAGAGLIRPDQVKTVNRRDILHFLRSSLARRMQQAALLGRLCKESQFVMSVPASRIDPALDPAEEVVVQGIVDAWFEEDGRIVLLDYKTDRVNQEDGEEVLRRRYAGQLAYYADALQAATGMEVAESWIYSFRLGREIPV